jgi:hypothetical protein
MTSNRTHALAIAGGVLVLLLTAAGIGLALWSESANETTHTCAVTDKDRTTVSTDNGSRSDMRIYTADCGTLAVTDLMTRGQFNSADIYASIEPGKTYEITTVGWRIPWLSAFPIVHGVPVEVTR